MSLPTSRSLFQPRVPQISWGERTLASAVCRRGAWIWLTAIAAILQAGWS